MWDGNLGMMYGAQHRIDLKPGSRLYIVNHTETVCARDKKKQTSLTECCA